MLVVEDNVNEGEGLLHTEKNETRKDCHSSNTGNENIGQSLPVVGEETRKQSLLDIEDDCSYRVVALQEQPAPEV